MPKPPLRRGLDPLIQIGLVKTPLSFDDDPFYRFLLFCEMLLNKQFTLTDLLRQSVYSRLAGYEDLNDAERLAS